MFRARVCRWLAFGSCWPHSIGNDGRRQSASGRLRLHGFGGCRGTPARLRDIVAAGQRHAHAALDERLRLAEQAQFGALDAQRPLDTVEDDALGVDAAVDQMAGTRIAQAGVDRQTEQRARAVRTRFAIASRALPARYRAAAG